MSRQGRAEAGRRGAGALVLSVVLAGIGVVTAYALHYRNNQIVTAKLADATTAAAHAANDAAFELVKSVYWTTTEAGTSCGSFAPFTTSSSPTRNWSTVAGTGATLGTVTVKNCDGMRTPQSDVGQYFGTGARTANDRCQGPELTTVVTVSKEDAVTKAHTITAVTTVAVAGGTRSVDDSYAVTKAAGGASFTRAVNNLKPTVVTELVRRTGYDMGSGPINLTNLGGHPVAPGDAIGVKAWRGREYFRCHAAGDDWSPCDQNFELHFELANGTLVPPTAGGDFQNFGGESFHVAQYRGIRVFQMFSASADQDARKAKYFVVPPNTVKIWGGFKDCGPPPYDCYFDNEGFRNPMSGSTNGCTYTFEVITGAGGGGGAAGACAEAPH
jgi:hypothetical protein